MKKLFSIILTLHLLLSFVLPVHADTAAQLTFNIIPTENTDGKVVLEIDMSLLNGSSNQSISQLEFRYENTLIGSMQSLNAGSTAFLRSTPIDRSMESMAGDVEIEITYIDFDGTPRSLIKTVDASAAAPIINFKRTASAESVGLNEKIKLTYIIKNEGAVVLTGLVLTDDMEGVGQIGTIDTLYPGDMRQFEKEVTITKDVVSLPHLSYSTINSTASQYMELDALKITLYQPQITVTLKSDSETISSGENTTLTCSIVNDGTVALSDVTVTDATLGTIVENVTLEVGKAYSWSKLIRPMLTQGYMVAVSAKDPAGNTVTATSNAITITVNTASAPNVLPEEILELTATPNTKELSGVSTVNFNILVRNKDTEPLTGVTLCDQNGTVLQRLSDLPVGDQMLTVSVNVDHTGDYSFTLSATRSTKETVSITSEPVTITIADSAMVAEEVTVTPTPEIKETKKRSGIAPWLVMILIVVILLVIACIVVLVVLQLRANRVSEPDEAEEQYTPPPVKEERPRPVRENPYDIREEISRAATEYSRPVQQPSRPVPRYHNPPAPLPDDEPTVYTAPRREPRTKDNTPQ